MVAGSNHHSWDSPSKLPEGSGKVLSFASPKHPGDISIEHLIAWRCQIAGPVLCRRPCPVSCVLCPMPYALCPMPYVLCPMSYVLCPMFYVLCRLPCPVRGVGYAWCCKQVPRSSPGNYRHQWNPGVLWGWRRSTPCYVSLGIKCLNKCYNSYMQTKRIAWGTAT